MTYSCLLFYISPLFWQNLVKRLTTIFLNLGFQRQAVVKKKFMDLGGQSLRRGGDFGEDHKTFREIGGGFKCR